MGKMNIFSTLYTRGLIQDLTHPELEKTFSPSEGVYAGFDPTADSLHVGHLLPLVVLRWFQKWGCPVVALIGGATAMIGDPSGKSEERNLLDKTTVIHNIAHIRKFLDGLLNQENASNPIRVLNNSDWLEPFSYIDFLRDVGKFFRMGPMLAKESVRSRLSQEEGMSFTEFSYQILQAYDFYHLHQNYQVCLQVGGSDQWGNITAGIDLIRKIAPEKRTYGLTIPLLMRSDGKKFGKTESGTVWLSSQRSSPYEFYQYFVRIPDEDVIGLMKQLTCMPLEEIAHYEEQMKKPDYEPNSAQKKLAKEVTEWIHGSSGLQVALKTTASARPGQETVLTLQSFQDMMQTLPSIQLNSQDLLNKELTELLVQCKLTSSKTESRHLIKGGGAYLNNQKVEKEKYFITDNDLIEGRFLCLSSGKKNKCIIEMISSESNPMYK